jgi:hypothetical protein
MTPHHRPLVLIFSLMMLSVCATAQAQSQGRSSPASGAPFSTLEERMTGPEFRETGLHKLTDEELRALNLWIQRRSLAEGEVAEAAGAPAPHTGASAATDQRGLAAERGDRRPIRSRIVGEFTGWDGNTEFELDNGMVWRQAEPGRLVLSPIENPAVVIEPGILGSWRLGVEGRNARVRVQRIR